MGKWASQVALGVKNPPASSGDARDVGSIPGSGRSPGGGRWQPTSVFLPGESPGLRRLVGYSPQGCKELDRTEAAKHTGAYTSKCSLMISPPVADRPQTNG